MMYHPKGLGIAAGIDKNGTLIEYFEALGADYIEIGTVTKEPRVGNPFPRIHVDNNNIINNMGLPNDGIASVVRKLKDRKTKIPVGLNTTYECLPYCEGYSDYIVLNVSCPNTEDISKEILPKPNYAVPIYIKISPIDNLPKVTRQIVDCGYDGIVACNSLPTSGGGLSGLVISSLARQTLQYTLEYTKGSIPVISVGGILSGEETKIRYELGASSIQICSGFLLRGKELIDECISCV